MDYDDIDDYDEDYSIIDIDNNWLNGNMDSYKTNFDSDSDINEYNYNSNTNYNCDRSIEHDNWSTVTEYKSSRHSDIQSNNHLLELVNNKLKALESIDRPVMYTKVERKGNSLIDLFEKMKSLDSPLEKERDLELHHRSPSVKTMIDNWHNTQKSNLISTDIPINDIYKR